MVSSRWLGVVPSELLFRGSMGELARARPHSAALAGLPKMFETLSYYWNAARGYRLRPWKSPYMRWRFETFLGREAADLTARKFFHLTWKHREHMERFVDWAAERRRFQHRHHA